MHRKPAIVFTLLGALAAALVGAGCAPAVVATGAAAGAYVVHNRRSAGAVVDDQGIELKALDRISNDTSLAASGQSHINVTSYNGIALMTGEAASAELQQRAVRLVRGIDGVREVHNELVVAAPSSFGERSNDTLLTTKVKSRMVAEKGFDSTRVKVVTERGVVYLMGIVTEREAYVATELARTTSGVRKVVKVFEYLEPSSDAG
jgi:osmotically-inducible protein OsmY